MVLNIIAIAIGGAIGAVSRYFVSIWVPVSQGFPYATLLTNLVGCFLLAFLTQYLFAKTKQNPIVQLSVGTGIIGSFTTFSTFSVETIVLVEQGLMLAALVYVTLSVVLGTCLAFAGFYVGRIRKGNI